MPRYSHSLSSVPGLPLLPDLGAVNASECAYAFRRTASDGHFVRWDAPSFLVSDEGPMATRDYGPVYWTWKDPLVQERPITITLEVLDTVGVHVVATARRTISWEGDWAVADFGAGNGEGG